MKPLTVSEKFTLIRQHGDAISRTMMSVQAPSRSDILERAQRIIELTKSIPKAEFGDL